MTRLPLYKLVWSKDHSLYELYMQGQLEQRFRPGDEGAWLARLRGVISFAFKGVCGHLNVHLEERSRGGQYWYAYLTKAHRTRKRYLGQSANVTFTRLEEVAKVLGSEGSPPLLAPESGSNERDARSHRALPVSAREVSSGMEVLSSKLSPPLLPARLLARERLLCRLDEACFHRLTLLSASAGWGKTTLLSCWASRIRMPLAWLSLDELDNDPARFWISVLSALRACLPGVGETALSMLRSPQPPSLSTVLTTLLNELCAQDSPIILLLEDYHLIDEPAIHDSLFFVLDHLPAPLHLVLSSRTDPPLSLARWRARGQLLELRDADLRFLEEEAAQFLTHTMNLSLSQVEIAELARRTEGWIVGLQLAALSLVGHQDRAGFVHGFTGSHRYVLDYVQEEILARLSPAMQDFVLSTCILHRMSASLCQAVTAQASSREMLETIERANLFLVSLDDERRWYRFHDLFREASLARLHAIHPEWVPQLHQRAAHWYEEQGEFREAIPHTLAAADFSYAASMMERAAQGLWINGESQTLSCWIMALPDTVVREHGQLVLTAALYLLNASAQTSEAQRARGRKEAEQLMARVETVVLPEAEEGLLSQRLRLLRAWSASFEMTARGDLEHLSSIAWEIENLGREDEAAWQTLPLSVTFALRETLRREGALLVPLLRDAKQQMKRSGDYFATIKVMQWLVLCACRAGKLHLTHQESLEALALLEQLAGYTILGGYFSYCLAHVFYQWNQLEEARHTLHMLIHDARVWQQVDLLMAGYLLLAEVELSALDLAAGDQALQEAGHLAQRQQGYVGLHRAWMESVRAQWWLAQGSLAEASAWASHVAFPLDAWNPNRQWAFLMVVRVHLAQHRAIQAIEMLQRFSAYLDRPGDIDTTIKFLALHLVALHQAGQREQVRPVAARLFALTEAEGYIRVYLDAGEPMKQVIKMLLKTLQDDEESTPPIPRAYISMLLAAFKQEEQKLAAREGAPQPVRSRAREAQMPGEQNLPSIVSSKSTLLEELTSQEQRVLRLLAAGRSNREIASDLVVSVNTVKAHVKNIYSKLHVGNRVAASKFARALHLL